MKWLHPRLAPAFLTTNVQRVPRSASGHVSDLLIEQLRERSRGMLILIGRTLLPQILILRVYSVQIPLIQTTQEPARDTQISESQFQTFIRPMLTRGWKLWFRRRYFMLEDSKLVFRTHFAPHFGRTFSFESIESGSKFLRDVETIVDKESVSVNSCTGPKRGLTTDLLKHEPMIMLRRGGKSITVATYTQEASGAPTTHPGSRGPGITLSDVNLAIMIEHIYPESDVQVSHHSEDIRSVAYLWGLQKKGQWITAQAATKSYVAPRKFRVLAIPSLPPSSRAWCSDDDYASLLVPLYTRGFRVFHGSRYGLETPLTKTPFLSRAFPFPTVKSAFAFAHDLLNAIRDEQVKQTRISRSIYLL